MTPATLYDARRLNERAFVPAIHIFRFRCSPPLYVGENGHYASGEAHEASAAREAGILCAGMAVEIAFHAMVQQNS
jgi:hypothetical protein